MSDNFSGAPESVEKSDEVEPFSASPVLPYTVDPLRDEPLQGWLFRAATMHGYPNPNVIGDLVGSRFPDLVRCSTLDAKLATLMSVEADEINRRAIRAIAAPPGAPATERLVVSYFGHALRAGHVRPDRLRVCPHCLKDTASLRNVWDLTLCCVCHIHGCELIDTCLHCEGRLGYDRRALDVCRCGYDLKWVRPKEASSSLVALWRYLNDCLNDVDSGGAAEIGPHNPIRTLTLNRSLDLLLVLSTFGADAGRAVSLADHLRHCEKASIAELRLPCTVAADLIVGGRERIQGHIAERLQALPKGGALLRQATGSIAAVSEWSLPEELAFLDRIVQSCVSVKWRAFVDQAGFQESGMSAAPQSATMTVADQRAPSADASNAASSLCDAMPVMDASDELGLEVRDLLRIFPSWHLSRRVNPKGRPAAPRVVSRCSVKSLRDELASLAAPWIESPLDSFRRFHEARSTCWHLGIETADLLQMLRSGRIRFCQRREQRFDLRRVRLNEVDLSKWWRQVSKDKGIDLIRVVIGRQILNVDNATFERLIDIGELPLPKKKSVLDDRKVPADVIFDAIDRLRIVRRLEEYCGLRTSELNAALESAGITPLTGLTRSTHSGETRMIRVDQIREPRVLVFLRDRAQSSWKIAD